MLVLSRKKDESIVSADNILTTVRAVSGDKISLGIQAPEGHELISGDDARKLYEDKGAGLVDEGYLVLYVVDIRVDKVRLGIDLTMKLPVHRLEVYEAIVREGGKDATFPWEEDDFPPEQCFELNRDDILLVALGPKDEGEPES